MNHVVRAIACLDGCLKSTKTKLPQAFSRRGLGQRQLVLQGFKQIVQCDPEAELKAQRLLLVGV